MPCPDIICFTYLGPNIERLIWTKSWRVRLQRYHLLSVVWLEFRRVW